MVSRRHVRDLYRTLVFFFLKTFFFNPLNNPVFVVLLIFLAFFYMEGSLDKYHVALILYLTLLSHYFVGNMFRDSPDRAQESSGVPLMRFFKILPVAGGKIYLCYLISAAIYVLLSYVLLGLLLMKMMKMPDLRAMQFVRSVAPDGDTLTTLTGYALTQRGIPYFVSTAWHRSLLFDSILKIVGGKFGMSLYWILAFIYICVFGVFQQIRPRRRFHLVTLFHKVPLAIYLLIGMVFATDMILTQNEIGVYSRFMFQHLDMAISLFLIVLVATILSTVAMSKSILNNLKVLDV